ncbi:hypothetical protein INS49_014933 [Diaporthe citri]|uniref:uncharacterized protein n=1 Tax=Diaporthe citri TaxID=83186 RepID=UPI001C803417|nr:uncharacterized protein INS49_014933 [Diaporthe citri]KAG6357056.1 hypothetical protein INS49_014933 [Diaporthe citri]
MVTDMFNIEQLKSELSSTDFKSVEALLRQLDKDLTLRTYLQGYALSPAGEQVRRAIRANSMANAVARRGNLSHLSRWLNYLEIAHPDIQTELSASQNRAQDKRAAVSRAGGNYNIGLKGTENGVVTRFPPEPSGYLHIGHAKAAFLNDFFAHNAYDGKLIVRFDDTNPAKEKQEFEEAILQDLGLLGIQPDQVTYTSDHFSQLCEIAEQMIRDGNAYADDNDPEALTAEKKQRLPSRRRDRPADESLAMFKEMRAGTPLGKQHCPRARIKFDSLNGALRDPAIYRFPHTARVAHHRTGWAWNIYPTYDFACPVVDSIEGVTHALRTTEYADRNEQYHWFLGALGLRPVHLWDFARISFARTFLSKRKLAQVVDSGVGTGWDDPRMPTVRGILRRGLTVQALREFMLGQGPSRNAVTMDWTILWAMNQKVIDPVAPRHTAVETEKMVTATILNGPDVSYSEPKPKHPKNPAVGTKSVTYGRPILLDHADAASLAIGEKVTLMGWGNAIVKGCNNSGDGTIRDLVLTLQLDDTDFRKTKKITWLAGDGSNLVEVELWEFDYLLTKDTLGKDDNLDDYLTPVSASTTDVLCDADVAHLETGDIIQLERKGFYRVDKAFGKGPRGKAVLFKIPNASKG